MKNLFKFLGIIALAAIITFAGCKNESDAVITPTVNELTAASVTITGPAAGATPAATASLAQGQTGYTVTAVAWKDSTGPLTGTFAISTKYTATVVLTATTGYSFASTATGTEGSYPVLSWNSAKSLGPSSFNPLTSALRSP